MGQVEKMLFFYSFSVQHQIYFAAVTDAITYALNINGDCDHKEITKKKTWIPPPTTLFAKLSS